MNKKQLNSILVLPVTFSLSTIIGAQAADLEAGRIQSTKCAICHGENGKGNGAPKSDISGMDKTLFIRHLHDFRSGIRKNVMMQRFTKNLSDRDIENLAAYYASK